MRGNFLPNRLVARSFLLMLLSCLVCCGGAAAQGVTLIQQVNPAPAAPIVWHAPEAIPFGTPLSVLQLNATSATAGTLAYQHLVRRAFSPQSELPGGLGLGSDHGDTPRLFKLHGDTVKRKFA